MHTKWTFLALMIAIITTTQGQHYSKQEKGMSISLFQFDPATLGLYNHAQANHISHHGRGRLPLHANPRRRKKTNVKPQKRTKNPDKIFTNSTAQFANKTDTVKQLSMNPSPNQNDAKEHLTNVKFDSLLKNSSSLIQPSNMTLLSGQNATKANTTKEKPKEELLFYRNKTNTGSTDNSEKVNSVKLTKTTPPEIHQENVPILKEVNATISKNATLNNKDNTSNFTSNYRNSTMNLSKNATVSNPQNHTLSQPANTTLNLNKTISAISSAKFLQNETTVFDVDYKRKRNEILAQYIPLHNVSRADRNSSFQAGSRKHLKHQMFPECYRCTKNSTYPECVRQSKILKCNQGLNNICFARSHKKKDNNFITYEMGCTNHRQCLKARAFPCRDGSKRCFTCCQFNRCNASPHHGVFETDEINLDELTKEKGKEKNASTLKKCNNALVVMATLLIFFLLS
ncbi:ras guanine nucleotide exchange factor L-like [Clytia hemisphaerica]|uniref:Cnidarian restricted protein n=1 Tax=Clytia hemisphaerica TaxID=252671 RepID=A0A7M5WTJ7_9CNID